MLNGHNIFITGGTGTLGRAIARRATSEGWDCHITIFSRDPLKQIAMKREYPHFRYVLGDICQYESLYRAMVGHDLVIHAAAQKHIPEAELNATNCVDTNVAGSLNVALAAIHAQVEQVVGISTDKVCHPVNVYGATKKLLEAIFREHNGVSETTFHLCRYGNVLGSNGSVLPLWRQQIADGRKPTITHQDMTRFWITEDGAVDLVLAALDSPPGTVVVPLAPALDMRHFAQYLLGDVELEEIGLRPGEKMHEELITAEEYHTLRVCDGRGLVYGRVNGDPPAPLNYMAGYVSSDPDHWLTADELRAMVSA